MQRWRKKARADEGFDVRAPRTIEETVNLIDSNDAVKNRYSYKDESFIHVVPSTREEAGQSFGLFSSSILKAVSEQGGKFFIDGTFKIFPAFILQLLIENAAFGDYVS